MPSFHLVNFGCRANQSDGAAIAAGLRQQGWTAGDGVRADWVVVNTCTVTAEADAEARRAIRRLARERGQGPAAVREPRIVVTGCYAQRAPAEVAGLDGVAAVVGHARQEELPILLSSGLPKLVSAERLEPVNAPSNSGFHQARAGAAFRASTAAGRTRATVKVQDGCDRGCSFCVIPMVRGGSHSLPLGGTLGEIRTLVAQGCQEAVISGINLGQWGRDLDRRLRLADLVRAVLEQTDLPRLRLSSVEPMDWDSDLTALMAEYAASDGAGSAEPGRGRFARHVHLPLQSGSDGVLRRMHRRYRLAQYAERVEALRRAVPMAAIGADVMVGFPGETEAEFRETRDAIAALPFTYLHIFTFSRRQGTEAGRRLEAGEWTPVPEATAAERARELRDLIEGKRRAFLERQIGRRLPVLGLQNGRGLSDNFLEVEFADGGGAGANRLRTVRVTGVDGRHLRGSVAA